MLAAIRTRETAGAGSVSARLHDEYVTAAYIGVSVQTVRRMRARRARGESGPDAGPPFVRVFSSVRYDRADVDQWIEELPRAGGERTR